MSSNTNSPLRTVEWKDNKVRMIDQTKLPNEFVYVEYNDFNQVADAIRQKHSTLLEIFEILGIKKDIANQDVEGMEHYLNPKTIKRLRKFLVFLKSNPKIIDEFNEF